MSNNLGLAGAQLSKPAKFAPLYTGRWSSGLWTNRSPLRDATTSRITEKFYGQAGDALIAGLNVEITNKLTLARRPGTSAFDTNSYTDVDRFYEFRLFNQNTEDILLMIDQANALYSLSGGVKSLVFTKSAGAGQSYMQSVGNILYFADGIDNKKWLQTLFTWTASTLLGTGTTPFNTTFMLDANGKLLQLYGTAIPITGTTLVAPTPTTGPVLTIHSSAALNTLLSIGDIITFPRGMSASWLGAQSSTVVSISGTNMVVSYPLGNIEPAGSTVETAIGFILNGGKPTTGSTPPVATVGSGFAGPGGVTAITNPLLLNPIPTGGIVIDGSAVWNTRQDISGPENGLENWGISNTPVLSDILRPLSIVGAGPFGGPSETNHQTYAEFTKGSGSSGVTLVGATIVMDTNGNLQQASSGTTGPEGVNPTWSTILGTTTTDNTVTWTMVYQGTVSTYNGGWRYSVALVNSLDDTLSNASPLSNPTGNFQGAGGVFLNSGFGLQIGDTVQSVDAQADMVAIFRTTDGQSVPFLIPGKNGETYTVTLAEYLSFGYIDNTPDTGLNNLIEGAIAGENTPPPAGALNLTYHLNRIWYSLGNVVYWTSGPDAPSGNGLNGTSPLNFDSMPSLVKRLVPTTSGMLVFTVSDVYIIQGLGTTNSPIQGSQPLLPGIGLLSYNALDTNGAIIGLFTTDNQFIILDPSAGTVYAGFPIGDQFRLNNGGLGTSWNPANVYVAWHVQGEDAAWYVCDGSTGWYRLMTTPAPETGYTWSPFAKITGGMNAVQSVEVTPGVHRLLLGPVTTGNILQRDLTVFADNGTPYSAYAVVGSAVLTQPGQVAQVAHIVTDCVHVGSPISIGILVDEALPYYTGPIDILKNWETDPPNLPTSKSFYSQRFYLSDEPDVLATMRHCQIVVQFSPADTVMNELLTLTLFGAYSQEL